MVTQVEIARRVGLDVSSVNKILNRRQGPVFRKDTIKKVFRIAKELGYDFGRLKYQHRRRHARKEMALGAEIYIYHKDGSVYDQGVATIRDLSLCGARISDVTLPLGTLPVEPFTVGLRPMQKPVDDIEIPGMIVRYHLNGQATYGVEFQKLESLLEKKLRRIANG
ncbi:MAG TPA: PilZ domain-containing protein [Planctomycetota bacterium]|nr:PilZ domain-containing protein [Planctomycetota bacterium]